VKFRVKVGYSSLCQIFSPKATEPGQELGNRKDGDTLIASRTLSEFSVPNLNRTVSPLHVAQLQPSYPKSNQSNLNCYQRGGGR
jgi:hypothetical protein